MTIAEGLVVNTISGLTGKILKSVGARYGLTARMRRELTTRNKKFNEESGSQIYDALVRALGNNGDLTKVASLTLSDLSNAGLLEHLVAISGSDVSDQDAKKLITYIQMSRGETDEMRADEFAKNLLACLKAACDYAEQSQDQMYSPTSVDRLNRVRTDSARRSASVVSSLLSIFSDKDGNWIANKDVSPTEISQSIVAQTDPLFHYVETTQKMLDSVDVHGASGDVLKVKLDSIFVDVPVNYIPRNRNFNAYQELRNLQPRSSLADNWADILASVSQTVLLGDPGGGKSTLSKKLCSEVSKNYLSGGTEIPIFVQLRTYIARAADDERLSLSQYILEMINATVLDPDERQLNATILYHLRVGAAFLVADGLDEVLTPGNRARVVEEIQKFSRQFPLARMLVTSRYVGYESQPLTTFRHLGVDHLSDGAVEQIYKNVSSTVLKKSAPEIEKGVSVFVSDAHKKARELIRSPLLLTLIVIIYSKKSEIPDNRASLYGFCADLLFERWDGYRDITPNLPERYRLFDLFKHLSSILYEKEEYGGRINRDDLLKEARDFFRQDYIDNKEGKSAEAAQHMVGHLTGRAWILHEVGENIFEFTHRTFMEFFYARHLETIHESTSDLVEFCIDKVIQGAQTVPSHLALQIRTKDKRTACTTVCNSMSKKVEQRPNSKALVDFCLGTLGYLLPSAQSMANFIGILAPPVLSQGRASDARLLLCTDSPMRSTILESCIPALQDVKSVEQVRNIAPALYALKLQDTSCEDSNNIPIMVLDQLYSKQASSPYLNKMSFDLDAQVNWKAASRFGFRLWFNTQTADPIALASDSRHMLISASQNLVDADYKGDKYLTLAASLSRNITTLSDGSICDQRHQLYRYYNDTVFRTIQIALDPEDWREDKPALEIFAFALALFIETNSEFVPPNRLKTFTQAFSNVIDALEAANSSKVDLFSEWFGLNRAKRKK